MGPDAWSRCLVQYDGDTGDAADTHMCMTTYATDAADTSPDHLVTASIGTVVVLSICFIQIRSLLS